MTYFVWVLAALVVAGIGWGIRQRSARLGQVLMGIGCLGCIAAIGWQVRTNLFPPALKLPSRAHTVVGYVLAGQAQRVMAGRTGPVVLMLSSALDSGTAEDYASSLRAPLLRGHPEWSLEIVTVDIPAKDATGILPAEAFKQVLAKYPKALAFVSFSGTPAGLESLYPDAPSTPPLYVFDPSGTTAWAKPLAERRIRSVVVPRPDVDPATSDNVAGLPGDIFGQLYYLATPENALQVAARLEATGGTPGRK